MADFHAVNVVGTINVLDAGKVHGMRRVVALSTSTFFDLAHDGHNEHAPVLENPPDDPYTVTKLAAFREVHERAAAGDDVLTCHPGAIYGPSPVPRRALHPTSFNAIVLGALRGKIPAFVSFPVIWVAGSDVAWGSIAALDRGVAGERYWLTGRPEDEVSTAVGCNRACEIAGVDHRVLDLGHRSVPDEMAAVFGPTLMSIAEAAAKGDRPKRSPDNPTRERLGYQPTSLDDGMGRLVTWLREIGKIPEATA